MGKVTTVGIDLAKSVFQKLRGTLHPGKPYGFVRNRNTPSDPRRLGITVTCLPP